MRHTRTARLLALNLLFLWFFTFQFPITHASVTALQLSPSTAFTLMPRNGGSNYEPLRRNLADDRLFGLNYGPFRAGQTPGGTSPTPAQIAEDVALMAQKVQVIRIYSSQGISQTIVAEAQTRGVQVIIQAWIDQNTENTQREIDAAIQLANAYPNVIAVLVGSEVLMRGDVSEAALIGYLDQVRTAVSVPVGYADDDYRWLNHPNLLAAVDWVGLDLYAFWNCLPLAQAAEYTRTQWQQVRTTAGFANKRVLVMETGWPNAGYNTACPGVAVGTEAAQAQFVSDMLPLAQTEDMDLFLFETADELWKCTYEPVVGCHWGLLKDNRTPWLGWNELPDLSPVQLLDPAQGEIVVTAKPLLRWSAVPNAAKYTLQIDDNSDFSSPAVSATTTTVQYTPGISLPAGLYYWRVRAHWGNWSDSRSFTVDLTAAPQRNRYTTVTPTLCWNRVTWAAEYELQVDSQLSFSSPLDYSQQVAPDILCRETSALTPGKHYWRVRAKRSSGTWGGWSAVETFVIAVP